MGMSGRSCLLRALFFISCFVVDIDGEAASHRIVLYPQPQQQNSIASGVYRTAYHFQPPRNWINDPNGPMYFNGVYHLFYQYNPNAAVWGDMHWGHSVSVDLINWAPLPLALAPTSPYDVNGCFSGSATVRRGTHPAVLYTGVDANYEQSQNLALPANLSDPVLTNWTKSGHNPLISAGDDFEATNFRDPTTAWVGSDGLWRTAVGAQIGANGTALLYRSRDFVRWERASRPLHSSSGSGMWECPDFYPVSVVGVEGLDTPPTEGEVKHVLKMSLFETHSDHYMLGAYDAARDAFVPEGEGAVDDYRAWQRYDHGKFYASKTFFDAGRRRRILWGWLNESDSEADDVAKGWAGIQTIPRTIRLDSNRRQLIQWPVEEVRSLRKHVVHLQNMELQTGLHEIKGVKASQADVEVDFQLHDLERAQTFDPTWAMDPPRLCAEQDASVQGGIGPFGLLVLASEKLEEHSAIFFRVYKDQNAYKVLMCSDQRRSSLWPELDKAAYGTFLDMNLEKESKISLRTLIDHSVIESFGGGGRACISARVYPSFFSNSSAHLYLFNNGSSSTTVSRLKAWDMAGARLNIRVDELSIEH
ncbi:beta-fructofuranosidase, insoluble isoenzyme 4-like [Zingiber officinale]|uniref:beta-fructofuranosidase, insoluble isoenzyme 4-like n=1 Tax=Zingiber officinale TaxID=94328 RepID=UPI001C4CC2C0|nr:beta-fructofuranosidase, insoluble isoenzyme 4-like [Zingiber officinale]